MKTLPIYPSKLMRKAFVFTLLILAFSTSLVFAGGWTQQKGGAYTKLGFMFSRATNVYDSHGEITPIRTLGTYSSFVYAEYGITKRITGITYFPFYVRNTLNETVGRESGRVIESGAVNNSLGDAQVGARFGIIQGKPFVLAASVTLGLPIGDAQDPNALLTGDGEFNQLVKLEAGYGHGPWYTTGYVGINNRTLGFSEEFRYEAEFGYRLLKGKILAGLKVSGVESLNNGGAVSNGMGLFANNVSYTAVTPEISYFHKENLGLSVSASGAFRGQNVLAAPAFTAGIFYVFQPKSK